MKENKQFCNGLRTLISPDLSELTPYTNYQKFETERPLFFPASKRKLLWVTVRVGLGETRIHMQKLSVYTPSSKRNTWQSFFLTLLIFIEESSALIPLNFCTQFRQYLKREYLKFQRIFIVIEYNFFIIRSQ